MPVNPGSTSVVSRFTQLHLPMWWNRPTWAWDSHNELGTDFSVSYGAPIGSITNGTVIYVIPHNNSINDMVGILSPNGVYHYQHITSAVHVGDQVNIGTVVGYQNGLPVDTYSTGSHIEVRYAPTYNQGASANQKWIDPIYQFEIMTGQNIDLSKVPNATNQQKKAASTGNDPNSPLVNPNQPCQALDVGCFINQWFTGALSGIQASLLSWGEHIGVFIIAVVLIILGFVLIGSNPVSPVVKYVTNRRKVLARNG